MEGMKIPKALRDAMREVARKFGSVGGKTAAKNMSPEERSARAKKASLAAAKKRTAVRRQSGPKATKRGKKR